MKYLLPKIEKYVDEILNDLIQFRHTLHENPEIALKEFKTSTLIREKLKAKNIKALSPFLETDVVAMLQGSGKGKNVTLRADIDALPLQEMTGLPYQSKIDGMMHACGHDGHTAMLMGAALVLNQMTDLFKGSVRFVFQPGEENVAAGKMLVEAGALLDPEPDAVFALHGHPNIKEGVFKSKAGTFCVASDKLNITIHGKGGHASAPHLSIDPIMAGVKVVEALQTVASRRTAPLDAVVVSICHFEGGANNNVIPDKVIIQGSVRYDNPELSETIPKMINEIVNGICSATGTTAEIEYKKPYIPTINDAAMVKLGEKVVKESFGKENWETEERPLMYGEDFSYYLKDYPGAMFRLGVGEDCAGLHSPEYDFNDNVIKTGVIFFVRAALEILNNES